MAITHTFVSAKADGADATLVRPSNWNAGHTVSDGTFVRTVTLVVAANNSSANGKAQADYVCDGTADQVEIQAALDALTSGGTILLLEGIYNITGKITITYANTTLMGVGYATCLKVMANMVSPFTSAISSTVVNVRLTNFQLDGNQATYTNLKGIVVTVSSAGYARLEGLTIHDCLKPIQVNVNTSAAASGFIQHCHIYNCTGALDAHHAGIYVLAASGAKAVVTSNSIYNIGAGTTYGHGVFVEASTGGQGVLVANNIIDKCYQSGIYIDRTSYILVDSNIIRNSQSNASGIYAGGDATYPSHNCVISNNIIYDDQATHTQYDGIRISGAVGYMTKYHICGNTVCGSVQCGIRVEGLSDSSIEGNLASGCGTHGILLTAYAHHNVVQNNRLSENSQTTNNTYSGIKNEGADYCSISGNTCRKGALTNKPKYGIEIIVGSTQNIIHGNDLYLSGETAALVDGATDTRKRDNINNDGTWLTDV